IPSDADESAPSEVRGGGAFDVLRPVAEFVIEENVGTPPELNCASSEVSPMSLESGIPAASSRPQASTASGERWERHFATACHSWCRVSFALRRTTACAHLGAACQPMPNIHQLSVSKGYS